MRKNQLKSSNKRGPKNPKLSKIPIKTPKNKPWLKNITRPPFTSEDQPENPGGRPKGSISIITYVKKILAENGASEAQACAASLIKNYKKGNPAAIKELQGRVDGVLAEKHEIDLSGDLMTAVASILSGEKNKKGEET